MRKEERFKDLTRHKKENIMSEKVTISKSFYEMLVNNTKRMNFLEYYRPTIEKDSEEKGVQFVVEKNGIIDTLRYGGVAECIDGAINDIREIQTVFWVGEETEIYAARSLDELVKSGFFTEDEMKKIKYEGVCGVINDLNIEINILDEETGKKEKKTIRQLLNDTYIFPDLLVTSYN